MTPASLCLVVLLHLLFLSSVFDIYFKSTVVEDVGVSHAPVYDDGEAPAKRLILFVADGLRAESFFSSRSVAFLHEMGTRRGSWGVSHTRVPTESRPGHVAMIAGMYEDPSAITRGWTQNPVQYDTVFNQSRRTWGWGSPDVIPMFQDGVSDGRMISNHYERKDESFISRNDFSGLNEWVFRRVNALLRGNSSFKELNEDKLVLFLHLLATDNAGHVHKPGSPKMEATLASLDRGVKRAVAAAENYWKKDGRTAYVFTADHGMTDWGAHGSGTPHETEVPLVVWGAGLDVKSQPTHGTSRRTSALSGTSTNATKISSSSKIITGNNGVNLTWAEADRKDVDQADIAPLMSALLGIGIPKHSEGRFPHSYLGRPEHKVRGSMAVARQIHQMVLSQRRDFERHFFHVPYPGLDVEAFENTIQHVQNLSKTGNYSEALNLTGNLIEESLRANRYYQTYFRLQLFVVVSLTYIGVVIWTVLYLLRSFTSLAYLEQSPSTASRFLHNFATWLGLLGSVASVLLQNVPSHFLVYYVTLVVVWRLVLDEADNLKFRPGALISRLGRHVFHVFLILFVMESVVAAFFHRWVLSLAIAVVTLWQLRLARRAPIRLKAFYCFLNVCLGVFTLLPTVSSKKPKGPLVFKTSLMATLIAVNLVLKRRSLGTSWMSRLALVTLLVALPLSGWLVQLSLRLQDEGGEDEASGGGRLTEDDVRYYCWRLFFGAVPVAMLSRTDDHARLFYLWLSLQSMYTLVSLSYEDLFLLCLSCTLAAWLALEESNMASTRIKVWGDKKLLSWRDVFRCLLFIFYSFLSFFGTGNVASINSFDVRSIACLVVDFEPYLMGALLMGKILIPCLVVSLFFREINLVSTGGPRRGSVSALVLLASELMSAQFFFLVTDRGSWLEVGSSLSHFVIAEAMAVFLVLLLGAAGILLRSDPTGRLMATVVKCRLRRRNYFFPGND